jgi:hypothetical protein
VKGHVTLADGTPAVGATFASNLDDLRGVLIGLPAGCLRETVTKVTGADGSYEILFYINSTANCRDGFFNATVDKTKLHWALPGRPGVRILPR